MLRRPDALKLGALLDAAPSGDRGVVDRQRDPLGAEPIRDRHGEVAGDDRLADPQLPDCPQHDLALGVEACHPVLHQRPHAQVEEVHDRGVRQHGGDPVALQPRGEDRRAAVDLGHQQAIADGDGDLVAHGR